MSPPVESLPAHPRRDAWWRALRASPHGYDLFQALRWLDALSTDCAPLGQATRPQDEPARLGQVPSLAFAASMVAGVEEGDTVPRIAIHGFGLFGPNGPLPLHLTEYAHERAAQHDDSTFAAFADLFHHRLIVLFYRAWADAQPVVGLDRPGRARFETYIASLIGRAPDERKGPSNSLAPHALYFHAPHLVRHSRNPEGLVQILRCHFGVAVRIVEHMAKWVRLDRSQRCVIRATSPTVPLGDAVLGSAVRDAQSSIRIVLGPLSLEQYRRFMPGGRDARQLEQWVREYAGVEFDWDVQLELVRDDVPACALGTRLGLGQSTWLGRRLDTGPARDLLLDYAAYRRCRRPSADDAYLPR
ncbi:type VI secretion system baseplate subunit TssG [Trinickia sp. LjRoot230]